MKSRLDTFVIWSGRIRLLYLQLKLFFMHCIVDGMTVI